jgi:hypothetical protein
MHLLIISFGPVLRSNAGAIETASARDIVFGHTVRYGHDELGTQRDHRKWNQHFILRGK